MSEIYGNTSSDGGGIFCSNSNPTIKNVLISNNIVVSGQGGGIHVYYYSNPILINVSV